MKESVYKLDHTSWRLSDNTDAGLCCVSISHFCLLQVWWRGDVPTARGVIRAEQPWLSASCLPAAALQSSAGLSTQGAWPAPPALRRSVPPSSPGCTALESRHHRTTVITMRHPTLMCQMMTKSTAKRRTSSRKRRKGVRNNPVMFMLTGESLHGYDNTVSTDNRWTGNYSWLQCVLTLALFHRQHQEVHVRVSLEVEKKQEV